MSSPGGEQQRYFCHQCNTTCIPQPPEFLCPTCNEGFIEPVVTPAPLSRPPMGMFPRLPVSFIKLDFQTRLSNLILSSTHKDSLEKILCIVTYFTRHRRI